MDQIEDLQERAYGRDGITRRREERESPFTEEISSVPIPDHIKIPRKDMCGYNGTGDPDDHLDTYLDWMNMQGASDALKCKIFPLTLIGDARTWISGLRRQSISSFAELQREFRRLQDGKLSWSLSKNGPSSYRELMERAEKYATAEEISGIKGKNEEAQSSEPKKPAARPKETLRVPPRSWS
ncbi:hypothetical protein ACOSP7_022303 [Xanthoceras sorbifolium]